MQHDDTHARNIHVYVIDLLCERLRRVTDDLGNLALLTLRQRLSRKLYDLAQSHAPGGQ